MNRRLKPRKHAWSQSPPLPDRLSHKRGTKWKRIQIFTHQLNPGSQSFQYPVSLLCLFLVKEHKKKCMSRPPASLSSPRQQGKRAHLVAGRTERPTERWTRRLLLELLTQAGPKAPCLSASSLLQEGKKKKNTHKKKITHLPGRERWRERTSGQKGKASGRE